MESQRIKNVGNDDEGDGDGLSDRCRGYGWGGSEEDGRRRD